MRLVRERDGAGEESIDRNNVPKMTRSRSQRTLGTQRPRVGSPSADVTLNYGATQAFTITPATGYNIADVLVDGVSVGTATGYTFTNVIAGHTIFASFTRGASGSCTPTLSPRSSLFNAAGGSGSVTVNVDSQCGWSAASDNSWITVTNGSGTGTGTGTLTYSVSQNQTSSRRTGTITISGQTFSVMQLR